MSMPQKTDKDYLRDANEIIRQQGAEIKDYRRSIAQLQKQVDQQENVRKVIFEIAERDPQPPEWTYKLPHSGGVRGTPISVWSDFHWGERCVRNAQTGLMDFNAKIAQRRLEYLTDRTIDLCFNHMGDPKSKYPGIIIALGGDMVGGDIHEELMVTNDRTPLQAVHDLTDNLAASFERLLGVFGYVYIPCVVGNHGRAHKKPPTKFIAENNYDYSVYLNLIRYFKKERRVQFTASEGPDCHFRSYHHRFCLTHGDRLGVKGGDGIIGAIGPIVRGEVKVGKLKAAINQDYDTLLLCHYHSYMPLPRIVVNGALMGPNDYSVNQLRIAPTVPTQALMFVHPRYGIIAHKPIYLEEPQQLKQTEAPWVSWQT
jgi:hypothetical protein